MKINQAYHNINICIALYCVAFKRMVELHAFIYISNNSYLNKCNH
jgi:hypothetical protein